MKRTDVAVAALVVAAAIGCAPPGLIAQQVKPRVHVIATGGTISNMGNDPRRTGAELIAGIPGIGEVADVTTEQFSNVASSAVTQEMLRDLARRIRALQGETNPPTGVSRTAPTQWKKPPSSSILRSEVARPSSSPARCVRQTGPAPMDQPTC